MIRIKITSITVDNQDKAHKFYTDIIGFKTKQNIPAGEYKWLTVGCDGDDFELLLEPNALPAGDTYQKELFKLGIPANVLFVDDIEKEYNRLVSLGVEFKSEPTEMGPVTIADFNDTCGNLMQLCQEN